jgi:hypothetical protein
MTASLDGRAWLRALVCGAAALGLGACSNATMEDAPPGFSNNSGLNNASNNGGQNNAASNNGQNNAANNGGAGEEPERTSRALVFINEVAAAGEPSDWFELINLGDEPVDLFRWTFTDDLAAPDAGRFAPEDRLEPGQVLQVFVTEEQTGFKLGGEEALYLFDEDGALSDKVAWSEGGSPAGGSYARLPDGTGDFETTDAPTPGQHNEGPDGNNSSENNDPNNASNNDPNNAQNNAQNNGSNNANNASNNGSNNANNGSNNDPNNNGNNNASNNNSAPPSPFMVVINEVAAAGEPADWFELLNLGAQPVSLDGWTLTDDASLPAKGAFAVGLSLPAGGRLIVEVDDASVGFGLSRDEELYVFDAQGRLVDGVDWEDGQSPPGGSYARLPDGAETFQTLAEHTQGEPNDDAPPALGPLVAINEVAAAGDPMDWFELVNVGDEVAQLAGWTFTDDVINRAVVGEFEPGTTLAPGAFLVIFVDDDTVGFKLAKDEALGLYDAQGALVDLVDWEDGQSPDAGSYARVPDGVGDFQTLDAHTQGASNAP